MPEYHSSLWECVTPKFPTSVPARKIVLIFANVFERWSAEPNPKRPLTAEALLPVIYTAVMSQGCHSKKLIFKCAFNCTGIYFPFEAGGACSTGSNPLVDFSI